MTPRQLRDVLAVLFMLVGLGGIVTVVFIACPLAGFGVIAAVVLAIGVGLALDR